MIIIGAVGKNGSGKDFVLERIHKNFGYQFFSIGDIVREIADKEGLSHTRDNLHHLSEKYMGKFGDQIFIEKIAESIKRNNFKKCVISGIRPYSDVIFFKNIFKDNFFLLYIELKSDQIRMDRMHLRGSARDSKTLDELYKQDREEEELFNISKSIEAADYILNNDGTIEELDSEIKRVLQLIETKD